MIRRILRFIYFRLFPRTAINQVAWIRGFYPDDVFDPDDEPIINDN